ncbi:MAG TPA: hypothetical protein VGQ55_07015, partial [Pyrinomonadaceae bacterium]|nr:hypothetical protein [Pyrinomonadaceae bacterium]
FRIDFSAGLVESVFDIYKKSLVWTKSEDGKEMPVTIGFSRKKTVETLMAKVGWAQFSATIKDESEKQIFLEIVRSYRKKP